MRRVLPVGVFVLSMLLGWLLWPRDQTPESPIAGRKVPGSQHLTRSPSAATAGLMAAGASRPDPVSLTTDYPIVAPLNLSDSTIVRDLETVALVLDAWRTNFPREGNPVGENSEITAALVGDNRLGLILIPRQHPAINAAGELSDRWGTPFRFHQLSGEQMEIRSAGPDRAFATADDVVWNPAP